VALTWLPDAQPDDTIRTVLPESKHLGAKLLEVTREGDLIECRVQVTARPGHQGMLYGTLRFYSERHSAPLFVTGRVVE
jgi:hypothetical protein